MNPFDRWCKEKPEIITKWDQYLQSKLETEHLSEDLRSILLQAYQGGCAIEKMLVLTALGAIHYYFDETR